MIKILQCDVSDKTHTNARLLDAHRLTEMRFNFGDVQSGIFPEGIQIKIKTKREPNDYFHAGPISVVSANVKDVFDSYKVKAEYFLLNITLSNGETSLTKYYYLNILEMVDCLDWSASEYTPVREYATKLKKIVLVDEMCHQAPVFLVSRTTSNVLCCSDSVVTSLRQYGCKGINYVSSDTWRNPAYPT